MIGYILILGIVMLPVYIMLLGWFLSGPRDVRISMTGVAYLASVTIGMWVGLAAFAALLGLIFF
jgi:hypothetical protein